MITSTTSILVWRRRLHARKNKAASDRFSLSKANQRHRLKNLRFGRITLFCSWICNIWRLQTSTNEHFNRASPRHRPGVRRPRDHARKGPNFVYWGGVYSNTRFNGGINRSNRKEDPNIYQTSAHQPFHSLFFTTHQHFIFTPLTQRFYYHSQHFISQVAKLRNNT